jgi:hypothetical protein
VPAASVAAGAERPARLALNLKPGSKRGQNMFARRAQLLAQRERSRHQRYTRMAAHVGVDIVKVEGVSERAVSQGSLRRTGAQWRSNNSRFRSGTEGSRVFEYNVAALLMRPGQHHPDSVEEGAPRLEHNLVRQTFEFEACQESRQSLGNSGQSFLGNPLGGRIIRLPQQRANYRWPPSA